MNNIENYQMALVDNDLSGLGTEQRMIYYHKVCESLGLNPLTQPFAFIKLNNKITLYAKRDCTEQLRKINGVSIKIISREVLSDCYIVTVQAIDKTGRIDESIGVVNIKGLGGENLSNAFMKAETKAKRRATLSIVGLGFLDESEVSSINHYELINMPQQVLKIETKKKDVVFDAGIVEIFIDRLKNEFGLSDAQIKIFAKRNNIKSSEPETIVRYLEVNDLDTEVIEFLKGELKGSARD